MEIGDMKVRVIIRPGRLAVKCPITKRWIIHGSPISERK